MSLFNCQNELIIGTNEEYILGYKVLPQKNGQVSLELSFANHSHSGRVKQVAVNGNFLVSGGSDEFVKIFNLSTRKEVGYLLPHDGTITCLCFHESGYLFSTAEDGKINIYKRGKWTVEKELTAGGSAINGFAVHPSGKLALSISRDRKLITWDMMKAKRVFTSSLKKAGQCVSWTPNGSHYVITSATLLDIYSVKDANITQSIDFQENIHCFCWLTDDILVVGGEKDSISMFSLSMEKEIVNWPAHETRTKCLVQLKTRSENNKVVASTSSDGLIKIWSINLDDIEKPPTLLGEVMTNCRVICMAAYSEFQETKKTKNIKNSKTNKKQKKKIPQKQLKKNILKKNEKPKLASIKKKKKQISSKKRVKKKSNLISS